MELEAVNQLFVNKAGLGDAAAALPGGPANTPAATRMTEMLASYDAKNAMAIARLVAAGTQLSVLPPEIIKALRVALETVLDEEAAQKRAVQEDPRELAPVPRRPAPLVLDRRYAGGVCRLQRLSRYGQRRACPAPPP